MAISDSSFPVCAERQDLLVREHWLRSDAKLEPDQQRAARLANAALAGQKTWHQHEEACPTCRLREAA